MRGYRTSERGRTTRRAALAAMLAAAGLAGPAAAQSLGDKFWLEGSAYFAGADTAAFVSRPGLPGTVIDFEDDLDIEDGKTLPAIQAGARFGRFTFTGEYYALGREGTRTLTRDIVFDGATYPASVEVDSEFKSNVYRATVGYSFILNDKAELGAGIGLHATDFELALNGMASVGGGALQQESRARSFLAPMPTVGIYGAWNISNKLTLSGRVDYLSLSIDDYSGSLVNAQAALGYRVTRNIMVGAAYRYVAYDLDVEKDDYTAGVDYDFNGPSIFVRVGFP